MSAFDYDNSFDDDWEERNELEWGEGDWQKYLKKQDEEVQRFLSVYDKLAPSPDRIDEAARLMGWEAPPQQDSALQTGQVSTPLTFSSEEDSEDSDDALPPYTVHQHPVYIVTQAFHQYLSLKWEIHCSKSATPITPAIAWKFAQSLGSWERHCLLGLQALDMGDFALTICHFKHTLLNFNHTLSLISLLPDTKDVEFNNFIQSCKIRLFDLREVWLRVINDCREEIRRQLENRD